MSNLKAAADMFMSDLSRYPNEVGNKMQSAFDSEDYQSVLDIAANHDMKKRNSLDKKVTMHPNPDFTMRNIDTLEEVDPPLSVMWEDLDYRSKSILCQAFLGDEKHALNYEWHYEGDKLQHSPMFYFTAEGIDDKFASAADAVKAYRIKHGEGQIYKAAEKHKFNTEYVFVNKKENLETTE